MSAADVVLERSFFVGVAFGLILYGIQLCLTLQAIYLLKNTRTQLCKTRVLYISYSVVLTAMLTIAVAVDTWNGQYVWLEHGGERDGSMEEEDFEQRSPKWSTVLSMGSYMLAALLGQLLLIHRCIVIWAERMSIMLVTVTFFAGSSAMALIYFIQTLIRGMHLPGHPDLNYGIPWIAVTSALNIFLSILIVGRTRWLRGRLNLIPSAHEHAETLTGMLAVLVESSLPLSILGIALTISMVIRSPSHVVLGMVWGGFVGIAPILIILRVTTGHAWSKEAISSLENAIAPSSLDEIDDTCPEDSSYSRTSYDHRPTELQPRRQSRPMFNNRGSTFRSEVTGNLKSYMVKSLV